VAVVLMLLAVWRPPLTVGAHPAQHPFVATDACFFLFVARLLRAGSVAVMNVTPLQHPVNSKVWVLPVLGEIIAVGYLPGS